MLLLAEESPQQQQCVRYSLTLPKSRAYYIFYAFTSCWLLWLEAGRYMVEDDDEEAPPPPAIHNNRESFGVFHSNVVRI